MVCLLGGLFFIIVSVVAGFLYKNHRDRSLLRHLRNQTPYVEVTPPNSVKKLGDKTLSD